MSKLYNSPRWSVIVYCCWLLREVEQILFVLFRVYDCWLCYKSSLYQKLLINLNFDRFLLIAYCKGIENIVIYYVK